MCIAVTNQRLLSTSSYSSIIHHQAATTSLIIMNLFSLITACLCVTTVVADDKLKFYNVKSPMTNTIPNNKGTASFTVSSDGSVTIDIDWDDATKAIVDGNDSKFI